MTYPTLLILTLNALITAAFWAAPALARPTLPFGVRIPKARAAEPVIVHARRRYNRDVLLLGAATFGALLVAELGLDRHPRPELVLPVSLACYCALGYRAHRSVTAGKRDGDWYADTRPGITADTSLRTNPVRPPWILLTPAVALLGVTAAIGVWRYRYLPPTLPTPNGLTVDAGRRSATTVSFAFATVTAQLLIILLIVILTLAIRRARPELDAEQPVSSATRYRAYLTGILRLLIISAGCANASLLVAALQVWEILEPTLEVTLVSYLPLAAAMAAWAAFAVRAGDTGHRLPVADEHDDESRYVQRDDDAYWHIAGMIYLNRRDPAILVHRRAGMHWTLNFGNPMSWALVAVIALVALLTRLDIIDLPISAG
ncbi:hypothetical protein DDE19_12450 [Micromonospora ureilytica]|uniref:DUF5808 domain-containing protein n=1 Tax=Micromonospora ureilytica TaxID=709868 RepID=A0A3N9XWA3_9ACTN|nr:hypothetical protein DDE19_12450 [Micromonospora ureilytica]